MCKSCSGTAPAGTDMLYCDSCFIHLCGNCMISNSFAHSQSCNNKLRYMSEHEMHLQYVPGSNNSSIISDCSRPPDKSLRDTKTDQQVPDDECFREKYVSIKTMMLDFQKQFADSCKLNLRDKTE